MLLLLLIIVINIILLLLLLHRNAHHQRLSRMTQTSPDGRPTPSTPDASRIGMNEPEQTDPSSRHHRHHQAQRWNLNHAFSASLKRRLTSRPISVEIWRRVHDRLFTRFYRIYNQHCIALPVLLPPEPGPCGPGAPHPTCCAQRRRTGTTRPPTHHTAAAALIGSSVHHHRIFRAQGRTRAGTL